MRNNDEPLSATQAAGSGSHGREELVEVEGQGVELLATAVRLEAPELVPPVVAPVPPHRGVTPLDRVVQEEGHQHRHERLRREGHVDHVVELPRRESNYGEQNCINHTCAMEVQLNNGNSFFDNITMAILEWHGEQQGLFHIPIERRYALGHSQPRMCTR